MSMTLTTVLVVHILISIALIGLVLIQRGKGADMGAAFGAGASGTVFGSQGSGNFLTRTTAILATGFFVTSLVLAFLALSQTRVSDSLEGSVIVQQDTPAAPAEVPTLSTDATDSAVPTLPSDSGTDGN